MISNAMSVKCIVILASLLLAPLAALNAAEHAHSDTHLLERTQALCRGYTEGFVSPATDLAYGKRLNGPRGIAVLEKPEEVAQGRVQGEHRPWGYGSGIEDPAYQTGMLLFALCDAEETTGDVYFAELARRVFRGLKRMSTISPVEGFVPRGPHPADGKSYYRDSSLNRGASKKQIPINQYGRRRE